MTDFPNFRKLVKPLSLLIFLINFGKVQACDLCSCTTGSGSAAFGDLSISNFIGLRYIYQEYRSRDGIFNNSPFSEERFNTYQLWGRIPICESFYLSAVLPYQDLTRQFSDRSESISGIGDMSVMGWYQVKFYQRKNKDEVDFNNERLLSNHVLNLGLGIKLPTGEFEEVLTDRVNPGFQVGTGSWDVFPTIMYGYSFKNFGIMANLAYYFKTENRNDYRFGNQFSFASNVFYTIEMKSKLGLRPFIAMSGDVYNEIEQFGEKLRDTDGSIVNGSIGAEITKDKFLLGLKYTRPIAQDLFGGNVESQQQFSVYLNVSI